MKKIFHVLLISVLLLFVSCNGNRTIRWWVSTENKSWEEQRNILWNNDVDASSWIDIKVYPDSQFQEIKGFGGCVNEKGWQALNTLPKTRRQEVLNGLFGNHSDLKFNQCRLPIGASDYAIDYYSLNDSAGDYAMEYFSIDRDRKYLIPYIKAIQNQDNEIVFWASPWTPPSWMKKNNHYACASNSFNKLEKTLQGKEGENLILANDTILKAYALYFSKYIKEYKNEGIEIAQLHVQNEFNSCQVFPSCTWSPELLSFFIGKYLGPRFEKSKIQTEIWLGTIERSDSRLVDSIILKNNAMKYIKGMGFQWGGKGAIKEVHKKYPNLPLTQTETECGDGSNNWAAAEYTFKLMKHYFDAGANSYMAWNMVLDSSGYSTWGWKQNALVSIDTIGKKYKMNPEFWVFKHFSHFVAPGSKLVRTSSNQCPSLAFITPNNELVLIVHNTSDKKELKRISVYGKTFDAGLMPRSFNTMFFKLSK